MRFCSTQCVYNTLQKGNDTNWLLKHQIIHKYSPTGTGAPKWVKQCHLQVHAHLDYFEIWDHWAKPLIDRSIDHKEDFSIYLTRDSITKVIFDLFNIFFQTSSVAGQPQSVTESKDGQDTTIKRTLVERLNKSILKAATSLCVTMNPKYWEKTNKTLNEIQKVTQGVREKIK